MAPEVAGTHGAALPGEELGDVLRAYMEVSERLQRTHEALQGEIVRLRGELAHKDRELELRRRLAALGELAAGVAHEVRNPLGAIQLYSNLLRSQCSAAELRSALPLIEKIEAGIQAIDSVVKDTLALAPRDRDLRPCRVLEVIERARDTSMQALLERRVRVEVVCEDRALTVRAEPDGLQRVLVNLLVNAAEASAAGAVVRVRVGSPRDEEVEISVQDEGPGLPEEMLQRVFEPFFTTKEHGTGLGLTIAHRFIETYGGRLSVGNRSEGGAVFVVALPTARPTESQGESREDARESSVA